MKNKATRKRVYTSFDGERANAWTDTPGERVEEVQHILQKIGAMCIRRLDQHGAPMRKTPKGRKPNRPRRQARRDLTCDTAQDGRRR